MEKYQPVAEEVAAAIIASLPRTIEYSGSAKFRIEDGTAVVSGEEIGPYAFRMNVNGRWFVIVVAEESAVLAPEYGRSEEQVNSIEFAAKYLADEADQKYIATSGIVED